MAQAGACHVTEDVPGARSLRQVHRLGLHHRRAAPVEQGVADRALRAHAEAQRHGLGEGLGQDEQVGRVAVLEFQLDFAERCMAPRSLDLALVQRDENPGRALLHRDLPAHHDGGEDPLQRGVGLAQDPLRRRVGPGGRVGRFTGDLGFPLGPVEQADAAAPGLHGLDVPAALGAHPEGQAGLAKRAVGGVVIGGDQPFGLGCRRVLQPGWDASAVRSAPAQSSFNSTSRGSSAAWLSVSLIRSS